MSDSLTDAQKIMRDAVARIPNLLATRRWTEDEGWHWVERSPDGVAEVVAVEIDKALGGLTREVDYGTTYPHYPVRDVRYARFVGGWTPEAGQ